MKLIIEVQNDKGQQVHKSAHTTKFNPIEITFSQPFEVDGWLIKAFALGVEREKVETISLLKTYQTRGKSYVKLYTTTAKGKYPVIGLVSYLDGSDMVQRWTKQGKVGDVESDGDLVEVAK